MTKEKVSPYQVRVSPETMDQMRALAARRGTSVHAQCVRAIEAHLDKANEPRVLTNIRWLTDAVVLDLAATRVQDADFLSRVYLTAVSTFIWTILPDEQKFPTDSEKLLAKGLFDRAWAAAARAAAAAKGRSDD